MLSRWCGSYHTSCLDNVYIAKEHAPTWSNSEAEWPKLADYGPKTGNK